MYYYYELRVDYDDGRREVVERAEALEIIKKDPTATIATLLNDGSKADMIYRNGDFLLLGDNSYPNKFFSCIITKDKRVLHKKGLNRHEEIQEYFRITTGEKLSPGTFVKVQIVPKMPLEVLEPDKWAFIIEEGTIPAWFTDSHEEEARKALGNGYDMRVDYVRPMDLYPDWVGNLLPKGLIRCGDIHIRARYNYRLPESLKRCGDLRELGLYNFPLPKSLERCDFLDLLGYREKLPESLKWCGNIDMVHYEYRLPESLKRCGTLIGLEYHPYRLPESLEWCGNIGPGPCGYKFPLPESLKRCGNIDLAGYKFPLPESLKWCGNISGLERYNFPLPKSLKRCGDIDVSNYEHPLPESLERCGKLSGQWKHCYTIPAHLSHL